MVTVREETMKNVLFCLVLAVTSAQAGLIIDTTNTNLQAYGFGAAPSILTLQRDVLERGCVVPTSGGFSTNCGPSGYTDLDGSLVSGLNKYAAPTLADLGVTSYSSLAILFNVNETGSSPQVTLQNLTLTLYSGTTQLYRFDLEGGPVDLTDIAQGQGSAGFVIRISPDQLVGLAFNNALRVGLAAEIGCTSVAGCSSAGQYATDDGAESFTIVDLGGPPQEIPEPGTAALLGGGLIALAWFLRRRKAS